MVETPGMVAAEDRMDRMPSLEFALAQLLSPEPRAAQQGVEEIMFEAQEHRDRLVCALQRDTRCQLYLATLCNLLASPDHRLCSTVAFILGTVAEDPSICNLLVDLVERSTNWELLGQLGAMLLWDDTEAAVNAAGALGTLAENSEGRRWILTFPNSNFIIENIAELLASPSDWTASNCALVLARICMSQEGCARILDHPKSDEILQRLIASLHVDEAGCGLNAAFALGRLCDNDVGRKRVLGLPEAKDMVSALEEMMSDGDAGGSRNACFAISCLATDQAGHQHILRSPSFPGILDSLSRLLQSEEQESCWFAAMTVNILSSYSQGVVRLRQHQFLEETLKRISASHTAGNELLEEVQNTLKNLQRLPQPTRPKTKVLNSGSIWVGWDEHTPSSSLPVTYSLFDCERLLYQGPSCTYTIMNTKPGHLYRLKVVMETTGDRSPDSPVTALTVEELLPGPPLNLQVTGRTTTKVKLNWSPPTESGTTIKGYVVYREESQVETTCEPSCIVGGLAPFSSYTFSVCACSSRGQGQKASIVAKTMEKGDHAPGRLMVYVIGRSEIFITWEVPRDPLGRFFNYELCLNGKPVYLGTERSYTARRLIPNTEYTCAVCAITSEGRFESRPVTKRTAKDEYSNLSKHHAAAESQPVNPLPTRENQNPPQRQQKTEALVKQSPVKNQQARLLMVKQTNRLKDKKTQAPNSRRGSWSIESTEDKGGLLESQVQPPKPCPARESDAVCHKPCPARESDAVCPKPCPARESDAVCHKPCPARESNAVCHKPCPVRESDAVCHKPCPVRESDAVCHKPCPGRESDAVCPKPCPVRVSDAVCPKSCPARESDAMCSKPCPARESDAMCSKPCPVRVSDAVCSKPSQPGTDNKKPRSANILRLLPVVSLQSLVPEYLVHQRAKTETALAQLTPLSRHKQHILDCPQESDKESSTGPKKTLQPLRDPVLRARHQNLAVNAWEVPRIMSSERRRNSFPGKYPGMSSEEAKTAVALQSLPRKNGFVSKPPGPLELRHQPHAHPELRHQPHAHPELRHQPHAHPELRHQPHAHPELSRIHSFQRIERKTRKPCKGHRIGGSLPDLFHRDMVALVGESGVTFRLPSASNSKNPINQRRHRQLL